MKNFWLVRRRKKQFHKRLEQVNNLIEKVIAKRLLQHFRGGAPWRQKKDTKTLP